MAKLELRRISKSFGGLPVVRDFSFRVETGEFLSLLGPSGCGKTTTLRIIAGLEHQDRGEVLIDGGEISDIPVHKRNIGFIFQDYALFPHMTVEENIAFGLRMRRISGDHREKAKKVLRTVDLQGYERRLPGQLSGGERQRVALCRALVLDPDILLMDEPLSNLDAKLRKRMRIEIKEIQRAIGITTIFVTHDQEEALSMSDRIILMNEGRAEQVGSSDEIYQKPASEFVANFMGQVNCYEGRIGDTHNSQATLTSDHIPDVTANIPAEASYQDGERVLFMIRKEGIQVSNSETKDDPETQVLPAEVLANDYLGSEVETICRFEGFPQSRIVRRSSSLVNKSLPSKGERIHLAWNREDLYIIGKIDR
jgi:ABC-type Fe3+/spermidine/putrescine transport system ATPase subunit